MLNQRCSPWCQSMKPLLTTTLMLILARSNTWQKNDIHAVVFWIMMTCSLVWGYKRFRKISCLQFDIWLCLYQKSAFRLHTVTTHRTTIWIFTTLENLSPIKSMLVHTHTQFSVTFESHIVWIFKKVSTSGVHANLHRCLTKNLRLVVLRNKFCQICQSPTQFIWKNHTQTQKYNSNTYSTCHSLCNSSTKS